MRIFEIIAEADDNAVVDVKKLEKEYRAILRTQKKLEDSYKSRKVISALKHIKDKRDNIEKQLGLHSSSNVQSGKAIEIELTDDIRKDALPAFYEQSDSIYSKIFVTVSYTGLSNNGYVTKFIKIPFSEFKMGRWNYKDIFKSTKDWRPIKNTFTIEEPDDIPFVEMKDILLVNGKYYIYPINGPQRNHKDGSSTYGVIELSNFVKSRNSKDSVTFISNHVNDFNDIQKILKTGSSEWISILKNAGFKNPENWTHWSKM